jgi:hypothetical protein
METKVITPQQKKLGTIRRILWIIFGGISASTVLLMVPVFILFVGNPSFRFVPGPDDATLVDVLPFMIATPFLLIGFLAVVCVVIYQIFKYRLEKDDDLFL